MGIRRVVAVGMIAWVGALVFATALAARPQPGAIGYLFSASVYAVGAVICHQLPDRSFHFHAVQWPVCARCAGVYAGAALAAFVMMMSMPLRGRKRPASYSRLAVAVGLLPNLISLGVEWTSGVAPSNEVRAAAGGVLGVAVGWVLLHVTRGDSPVGVH